jgi:hypothetical protein
MPKHTKVRRHARKNRMVRAHLRNLRERSRYPTRRRLTRAEKRLLREWGGPYGSWEGN